MQKALAAKVAAVVLACASADSPAKESKYGKTLVAQYEVPQEVVMKYADFVPSKPDKHESAIVNAMLADTVDWVGRPLNVESSKNPYTVVVTVIGKAKSAGDATSLWQVGWKLEGGESLMNPLGGLSKSDVKAGERVELTVAARPTSFKEDRSVGVVLGLVNARNFDIDRVNVAIWSGIPGATGLQLFGAYYWVILGAVMIALWWFWMRRSRSVDDE
jgi:hypothetical protein